MKTFGSYIVLLVLLPLLSFGQQQNNRSRSELGAFLGGSYYIGDLNPFGHFQNTHLSGGLLYRFNIDSRHCFRTNFTYGKVSAADANSKNDLLKNRNLSFESNIFELGAGFEFNYFPFQIGHERYKGTAYLLAELALFRMNPKTEYNGSMVELQSLGTEGQGTSQNSKSAYGLTQLSLPLGVGAKFSLGKVASLSLEYGFRLSFTDYLDDVKSNSFVDPSVLASENGPMAAALSNRNVNGDRYGKRGNSSTTDCYVFFGGMLTFRLGGPNRCYNH